MNSIWRAILDDGWRSLKLAVAALEGRADDDVQIEHYSYAFSYASLSAIEDLFVQLNNRVDTQSLDFRLSRELAATFLASTLSELQDSLTTLTSEPVQLGTDALKFIRETKSPQRLTNVHNLLVQNGGQLPWESIDNERDAMRTSLRRFSDEVVAPQAEAIHREDKMIPEDIIDGVRELGCFGFSVPTTYGGLKPGDEEDTQGMVVVTEELSRGSLGAAGSLITRPEIMVRALLEGGTESQRKRWLPGLAAGEPLCAVSVTEPNTGSDVASVALRATRTEGGWLLNGSKTWCTFAGKAGLILVLARTDPDATPPHRGLSLFVIEKPATNDQAFEFESSGNGKVTGRAIATLGYRGMHSFEMHYDDFFVPESNLVGEEQGLNRGFYFTMRGFSGGRLQTAARAVGLMQAAFEAAYRYANNRVVFDKPILEYPLTQMKLLEMASLIVTVRRYSYQVATLMDRDEGQLEASLVKLIACRAAEFVTREALQIHGGMGYAEESSVSRYFVDARVLSIFEGAEEILALKVIGRALSDLLKDD